MKRVFVVMLALVVPGIALWSCASPTDIPFGTPGGDGGQGGSGQTATTGGQGGGGGQGGMIGQGGATASTTTAATTTAAVTTTTSTSSGGGCNDQTCLQQCLNMFQCGVCENGMCTCVPFDQCDIPFDAGLPDFGFPDFGFP